MSGQLAPGKATTIRLYCRTHGTVSWTLITTRSTNPAGAYSLTVGIPNWLPPVEYDLVALWVNITTMQYAVNPIKTVTVT